MKNGQSKSVLRKLQKLTVLTALCLCVSCGTDYSQGVAASASPSDFDRFGYDRIETTINPEELRALDIAARIPYVQSFLRTHSSGRYLGPLLSIHSTIVRGFYAFKRMEPHNWMYQKIYCPDDYIITADAMDRRELSASAFTTWMKKSSKEQDRIAEASAVVVAVNSKTGQYRRMHLGDSYNTPAPNPTPCLDGSPPRVRKIK